MIPRSMIKGCGAGQVGRGVRRVWGSSGEKKAAQPKALGPSPNMGQSRGIPACLVVEPPDARIQPDAVVVEVLDADFFMRYLKKVKGKRLPHL